MFVLVYINHLSFFTTFNHIMKEFHASYSQLAQNRKLYFEKLDKEGEKRGERVK